MQPTSPLTPFPPLDPSNVYDFVDTTPLAQPPSDSLLETPFDEEAIVYDISEIFRSTFLPDMEETADIPYLTDTSYFTHCFTRPIEGLYAIYWDRERRTERIRGIIDGLLGPNAAEAHSNVLKKWLSANLWKYGPAEIQGATLAQFFVTHMRHFEQLYVFQDTDPEILHLSRFNGNFVYLDERGEELFFASFFHKATFHQTTMRTHFIAHIILHKTLLTYRELPFLLQNQIERDLTFSLYPPIYGTLHQNNFAEALQSALSPQTTSIEEPKDLDTFPLHILDCTAGFLAQIQEDDTLALPKTELDQLFQMEVPRIYTVFQSADLPKPEETEPKITWLLRLLSPWIYIEGETPSQLYAPILTWFCQNMDSNFLQVFQDPEKQKNICSTRQRTASLVYLRTLPEGKLASTILKTNFMLHTPDKYEKYQGYFTMMRMAIFDPAEQKTRYNGSLIVHPQTVNLEEAQQLMLHRPEGATERVIFN